MAGSENTIFNFSDDVRIILQQSRRHIIDVKAEVIIHLTVSNLDLVTGCSSLSEYVNKDVLREIQDECKAKAPMDLELGEYVVTSVGAGFKGCYIYHCACWTVDGEKLTFKEFATVLGEWFEAADSMGAKAIAVPIIGINSLKGDGLEGIKTLAEMVIQTYLSLVTLPGFNLKQLILHATENDKRTYENYRRVLKELSSQVSSNPSPSSDVAESEPKPPPRHTKTKPSSLTTTLDDSMNSDLAKENMQVSSQLVGQGARPKQQTMVNRVDDGQPQTPGGTLPEMKPRKQDETAIITKVYIGDITDAPVEAIVHGAYGINTYVNLNGGVGKALVDAGGPIFAKECKQIGGGYDSKAFVRTSGGRMKYKHVIHVNTSQCVSREDWQALIRGCLDQADELNIRKLAFPGIRTNFTEPRAQANNFKTAIEEYIEDASGKIEEIHIILFDEKTYDLFSRILNWGQEMPVQTSPNVFPSRNVNTDLCMNFNGIDIVVKEGDITDETVDCVVHGYPVNNLYPSKVSFDDKLGLALVQKAGNSFKARCETEYIPSGSSTITQGGGNFRNVLHIDTTNYGLSLYPTWEDFMKRCLDQANIKEYKSIAFPVLGPTTDAKRLVSLQIQGLRAWAHNSTTIKEVRFVIPHSTNMMDTFKECITKVLGPKVSATENGGGYIPYKQEQPRPSYSQALTGRKAVRLRIEVVEGDIIKDSSDMIVHGTSMSNAATGIVFRGKLGEELKKAGGSVFETGCKTRYVPRNSFTVTPAGGMNCRFVIHVDIYTKQFTDKVAWKKIIKDILYEADRRQVGSLAFPSLGLVGIGAEHPTTRDMVSYYRETLAEFELSKPTYLHTVRFVIHNNYALYKTYKEVLLGGVTIRNNSDGVPVIPPVEQTMQLSGGIIGDLDMTIVCGDLVQETTDAIVHATGNPILFNGESGKALKSAGGPDFEQACKAARFHGTSTVFTIPGNLLCTRVLHLDMGFVSGASHAEKLNLLTDRVYECLATANDEKLGSISFPALGTGKYGCMPGEIANCFEKAIKNFYSTRKTGYLNDIRLVVYQHSMFKQFTDVLTFL